MRTRFVAKQQETLRGSYVSAIVDMIVQWCARNSAEYSHRGVVEFRASKEVSTECERTSVWMREQMTWYVVYNAPSFDAPDMSVYVVLNGLGSRCGC